MSQPIRFKGFIGFELFTIKSYIEKTEEHFKHELSATEAALIKESKNNPDIDISELFEAKYENEFYYYEEFFPQVFRKSMFISIYSTLEKNLDKLCMRVRRELNINLLPSDISGKGIERSKIYLTKVAGIEFPSSTSEWNLINKYNKIRNYFTHDDGLIPKEANEYKVLRNTIESLDNIKLIDSVIPEYFEVKIEKEFNLEVINTIQNFFNQLK